MSASAKPPLLSVNIDHIATLREARKAPYPDPLDAARLALAAGANGITVHLREDRRHIQDRDLERLCAEIEAPINLEIAATEAMVRIAREAAPRQVTLVPERADEITTEGGLDLRTHKSRVERVATTLAESGILVSLFIDPEEKQLECARAIESTQRFEINTDAFTRAFLDDPRSAATARELENIERIAKLGEDSGLHPYAGHGLTTESVVPVAAIRQIEELNIGHWIVSRASLIGMTEAVREMLAAIDSA